MGVSQGDFSDYMAMLQAHLDPSTDYVLVDASAHQPDMITGNQSIVLDSTAAITRVAPMMANNVVPILLADDTTPQVMSACLDVLADYSVSVGGIDMQNSTEVAKHSQLFRLARDEEGLYQALVRKSSDLLH